MAEAHQRIDIPAGKSSEDGPLCHRCGLRIPPFPTLAVEDSTRILALIHHGQSALAIAELALTCDVQLATDEPERATRRNVTMGPARGVQIRVRPRAN